MYMYINIYICKICTWHRSWSRWKVFTNLDKKTAWLLNPFFASKTSCFFFPSWFNSDLPRVKNTAEITYSANCNYIAFISTFLPSHKQSFFHTSPPQLRLFFFRKDAHGRCITCKQSHLRWSNLGCNKKRFLPPGKTRKKNNRLPGCFPT